MAKEGNAPRARELIIIGMHRSGTSLMTRLLNLAGAYFGPESLHTGKNEENPKGFWERSDVRQLNDLLLYETTADWDRPLRFSNRQLPVETLETFETGAKTVVEEFANRPHTVLKEPRFCLTLPFWRPFLRKPVFIWVNRHPLEVALSLQKRNDFPLDYGLALWEWYTLTAWRHLQSETLVVVHHADFIHHPVEALKETLTALEPLGFDQLTMPSQDLIESFVEKKLHRARLQGTDGREHLSPQQQELWDRVSHVSWDWQEVPPEPSPTTKHLLGMSDATADTLLRRLQKSRDTLTKDRDYWALQAGLLKTHNRKLRQEIKEHTRVARRMMKRLTELEQAWSNLRASKLWKIGLAANKLRHMFRKSEPMSTDSSASLAEKPTPDELHPAVTVIVPIYNAFNEVKQCIESLLENTRSPHRLLLINDASDKAGLAEWLDQQQETQAHVHLIHHPENAGYTRSVNEGITWAGNDDVVLLNSDTIVPSGWLRRLQQSAYSRKGVATVTPLSNAAGAFSIPENQQVNALPDGYDVETFAQLVRQLSPCLRPQVPTGNGFCLFIRRQALKAVGSFDEQAFPRGYGEENDFCMRASASDFVHLIDDHSFVFHHRSASFGDEKQTLVTHAGGILAQRWPEYKPAVNQWLAQDPLDPFRAELGKYLASPSKAPPAQTPEPTPVLFVLHDGGGGTRLTAGNLMTALAPSFPAFMLVTSHSHWELFAREGTNLVASARWEFAEAWQFEQPISEEQTALLRQICSHYGIQLAHVRHFLGNAPEILPIFKGLGIRVVLSFHDFYAVCPNIHLIDRTGRFCGGDCHAHDAHPSEAGFHRLGFQEDCALAGNWFQDPPLIRHHYIATWRERVNQALSSCDHAVTASRAAQAMVLKHFPQLKERGFERIEHGRNFATKPRAAKAPDSGTMDLICFGALNRTKGLDIIEALAKLDQSQQHFRFHLLGHVSKGWQPPTDAVVLHGPYTNDRLFSRLAEIRPSLALIPSLCLETYCHTLTEAWVAGLPVICSDIGTLRERVQKHGGGWLADPYQPEEWYLLLNQIREKPEMYQERHRQAAAYKPKSIEHMAGEYMRLYQQVLSPPTR